MWFPAAIFASALVLTGCTSSDEPASESTPSIVAESASRSTSTDVATTSLESSSTTSTTASSTTSSTSTSTTSTTTTPTTTTPTTTTPTTTETTTTLPPIDDPSAPQCTQIYDDGAEVLLTGIDILDEAFGGLTDEQVQNLPSDELSAVFDSLAAVDGFAEFDQQRQSSHCFDVEFSSSPELCGAMTDRVAGSTIPPGIVAVFLEPLRCA